MCIEYKMELSLNVPLEALQWYYYKGTAFLGGFPSNIWKFGMHTFKTTNLQYRLLWYADNNINLYLLFNFHFQVLLLVDASFGFEMETFEFLNICQVHGFPRIMGVLTHLDAFKDNKQMRKTKKRLKHRFWTEVYQVNCLWEILSTDFCLRSNAVVLILHIKLKREIT